MHRLKRIYILGTIGSGKSTLARKLSSVLKIKKYDLDDIFWKEDYDHKRDENERNGLFHKVCMKKKWIIEWVYSRWIEKGIQRSDLVIFLDLSLPVLLWRATMRMLRKEKSKKLGKKRYKESLGNYIGLVRAILKYKKKSHPGYYKHLELIGKHKVPAYHIHNQKELDLLFKKLMKN